MLKAFAVAAQLLVTAAVLMVALVAVASRRRILALLRALGAPRAFLFLVVWLEVSALLALAGGAGLIFGWGIARGFAFWAAHGPGLSLDVALAGEEYLVALAAVAVGIALASLPAVRVYRASVDSGLRDAGT